MKKLDFSGVDLMELIKTQMTNNSQTLAANQQVRNLPLLILEEPVTDILQAHNIFSTLLERKELKVHKVERSQGSDDIPAKLYVAEIDTNTMLALSEDSIYLLDGRIYKIPARFHSGLSKLQKISNSQIVAEYK